MYVNAQSLIDNVNQNTTITPDFNYTYTNDNAPHVFCISKKSDSDPYKTVPVVYLSFSRDLPFVEMTEVVKNMCDFYAKREHQYNKEKKE